MSDLQPLVAGSSAGRIPTGTVPTGPLPTGAHVLQFHPTPVFTARLPEAAEVCATLRDAILDREAGSAAGLAHSNVGGWHSARDMTHWGGPALDRVLARARTLADRLTVTRDGKRAEVAWRTECWANVNRRGHANTLHTHPGCYWSGTFYVDDGGVHDDPALGGSFEFFDPRGVAPLLPAAGETPAGDALGRGIPGLARDEPLVRPRAGMMVLFPSWMPHGVRTYHGNGTRISIAFNLALRSHP